MTCPYCLLKSHIILQLFGVKCWIIVVVTRINILLLHSQMHIFHFSLPAEVVQQNAH